MAGRSQLTDPVGHDDRLVIPQIISATHHRWLRPTEICEILQNHKIYHMCTEPKNMPPSGSIFLFNRKEQRNFRRDGHNWKKKKDGKTLSEANEGLKVGGVNVLHCYYARGEENENFQRRSYWIFEEIRRDLSHIVLVHYLEVKRKKEHRNAVKSVLSSLDSYTPGPSPSHDQLFSIVDFTPDWGYENSETKVLIIGRFLEGQHAESCQWSCMFGEVEVPAEVIREGVLRCYTPAQKAGTLSFCVTCSNRPGLACSQEKKFEYLPKDYYSNCSTEALNMRFKKLLSSSSTSPNCDPTSMAENSELSGKISSLLKNDNDQGDNMLHCLPDENVSWQRVNEQSLQPLKEKLHAWLLQKLADGGKGPSVLDEGGQGVLHFGAALGYDWVLLPTIIAGLSVDFCDVNGWTALHWAAFWGRDETVKSLIDLGALTDPTTKSGETPAELAFEKGHLGTADYLANVRWLID